MPTGHAAFFVQRVDSTKPLLAHNADKRMNPASTMKLVTTYAALELLGPAHVWKTQALADEGRIERDKVAAALVKYQLDPKKPNPMSV